MKLHLCEARISAEVKEAHAVDVYDSIYDALTLGYYDVPGRHVGNDPTKPLLKRKVSVAKRIPDDHIFANPYADEGLYIENPTEAQVAYVSEIAQQYNGKTRPVTNGIIIYDLNLTDTQDPWAKDTIDAGDKKGKSLNDLYPVHESYANKRTSIKKK